MKKTTKYYTSIYDKSIISNNLKETNKYEHIRKRLAVLLFADMLSKYLSNVFHLIFYISFH